MLAGCLIVTMVAAGISASVLNKYIVTYLHISGKFFILSVQTVFLLLILSAINFFILDNLSFKIFSIAALSVWMLPAVSLVIMIYSGLEANARLPISLFTVLKNLTIPVIALHDTLYNGYKITPLTLASFVLILGSSFLGAYSSDKKRRDSVSLLGILWMMVNCFSSAAYIIRFNSIVRKTDVNSAAAAWIVNALAFPMIFLCFLVEGVGDAKGARMKEIGIIALSGGAACSIAVANAQAAHTFTTTTVAVINALNKLPIAASGVIFGFESTGRASKWVAVLMGVASSILYAVSRSPAHQ
ncbi:GDP-mannose transporter [Nematocida minor]|uniref:GDP-mannose transporter n=1 Tax=Nematocida minor TaxID=1912983 RepID=UPI00221FF838|nr:GDP-mannose transporter [Nematocida minor]KAI5192902.1 GDP-mannose transporter [Nematocida minor]